MSITESARRIFSVIGKTHTLFYLGGAVVEIAGEGGKVDFEAISDSKFCSRMERYDHKVGSYVVHPHSKEAVLKTKACTVDKARQLLASLEASEYLPQVSGISNCDILIEYEEGTKVLSAGYHPECGGIYVAQKREVEKVSWEEGVDAVRAIMSGFRFKNA